MEYSTWESKFNMSTIGESPGIITVSPDLIVVVSINCVVAK